VETAAGGPGSFPGRALSPLPRTMSPTEETRLIVPPCTPEERLDVYVRSRCPTVSRATIRRLIESGDIRVDGRLVKPTHTPRAGEAI